MLLTKIIIKNYKAYRDIELDLSISDKSKPIILIGGANGGGKTSLFQAIYSALYGLSINDAKQFKELVNLANPMPISKQQICFEIHFLGKVSNGCKPYIIKRVYQLNAKDKPVFSTTLIVDKDKFVYGSATHAKDKIRAELEINKVIKANLPKELASYFMFDAMVTGNLLEQNQLSRVIQENVEQVMGFHKYLQLSSAAQHLLDNYNIQQLQVEKEQKAYLNLIEKEKSLQKQLADLQKSLETAYLFSLEHRESYEQIHAGFQQNDVLKRKVNQLTNQVELVLEKEARYESECVNFVREFERQVILPVIADYFREDAQKLLTIKKQVRGQQKSNDWRQNETENLVGKIAQYLSHYYQITPDLDKTKLVAHLLDQPPVQEVLDSYDDFNELEVMALTQLMNTHSNNSFLALQLQKKELESSFPIVEFQRKSISELKQQISGEDNTLFIQKYDNNEIQISDIKAKIKQMEQTLKDVEAQKQVYQIQGASQKTDVYDTLQKLPAFFRNFTQAMLHRKKRQLEEKMKEELNEFLLPYKGVIDKVILSENLENLTLRVYHQDGTEIVFRQLNTASKQIVVQCLLKALHQFGDYQPPVMIDTVMGVLDEESRSFMLTRHFPTLAHQTILFSSNSEIRPQKEYPQLLPFISRTYTLQRDVNVQKSEAVEGYFGHLLKE